MIPTELFEHVPNNSPKDVWTLPRDSANIRADLGLQASSSERSGFGIALHREYPILGYRDTPFYRPR